MNNFNETDPFLQRDRFRFGIEELSPIYEEPGKFNARIIPYINSKYFPPYHLRDMKISQVLLEKEYYSSLRNVYREKSNILDFEFRGHVKQGASYEVLTNKLPANVFKGKTIISVDNNIFDGTQIAPNFKEDKFKGEKHVGLETASPVLKPGRAKLDALYLYCFNVGQGDSFLLITPTGEVFIIDVNIYPEKRMLKYVESIKRILKDEHGLSENNITGLIITHKHVDHLRGADVLINSDEFCIDNFFINLSYSHPLPSVHGLLAAANSKIKTWCNVNRRGLLMEKPCFIQFSNPSRQTATNNGAPDINDSSIYLFISYEGQCLHLTGDIGFYSLNQINTSRKPYKCWHGENNFLKVSHHGSRTGTNDQIASIVKPTHAFISVGTSKIYNHPHKEALDALNHLHGNLKISKIEKTTVRYKIDKHGISHVNCPAYSLT